MPSRQVLRGDSHEAEDEFEHQVAGFAQDDCVAAVAPRLHPRPDDGREQVADAGLGQPLGQERRLARIARLPVRAAVLGDQRSAKQFGRDLFEQRRGHVLMPEQCERIGIHAGHQVSGRAEIQPEVAAQRPFRAPQ